MSKIENGKLINAVRKIPSVAQKDSWVLTLDRDEGALFYAPKTISDKSELFQITDEYALYMDKAGSPEGVMIEYYGDNFVEHHPAFKKLSDTVFGKDDGEIKTIDPRKAKQSDAMVLKELLEKTLIAEAFELNPQ